MRTYAPFALLAALAAAPLTAQEPAEAPARPRAEARGGRQAIPELTEAQRTTLRQIEDRHRAAMRQLEDRRLAAARERDDALRAALTPEQYRAMRGRVAGARAERGGRRPDGGAIRERRPGGRIASPPGAGERRQRPGAPPES